MRTFNNLLRLYSNLKPQIKLSCIVLFFILLAEIVFIFSNSADSATVSSGKSGVFVTFFVENILGVSIHEASDELIGNVTYFVRKFAHFTEFAIMSATLSCLLCIFRVSFRKTLVSASAFSFLIGCIDEVIQLFSNGRAGRFTDVLIDSLGGFSGSLIVILITHIISLKILNNAIIKRQKGELK